MSKFSEWSPELEAALAEPFPADQIKQKAAGGSKISFVPWHRYVSKLNALVGGGWSMGQPITLHVGDKLVMGLPVTILGTTRCNFGDEDDSEWEEVLNKQTGEMEEKKTMYGSPVTNAFAQSFKRTCALFGMGLDLYDKGGARGTAANTTTNATQTTHPQAAARDTFSLDTVAGSPQSKAKGRTWRELLSSDEGRGYVKWCLDKQTTMAPNARTALQAAMEGTKADGGAVVVLQDLVNRAVTIGAINPDHESRINEAISRADSDELRIAKDFVETAIQKKKLSGAGV